MKYSLFPRVDFMAYLRSLHVAYHPGRQQTEAVRRLIMHMTSESVQKRYPHLRSSWELLAYDAPATIRVELVDGTKKQFIAEHYSRKEMEEMIDSWKFDRNLEWMPELSLQKPPDVE
mmetsp:Transcript_102707/g.203925  ORF Transcript_102707/g.203925 Transcript_102707/m.203925 type:complete len:117 (+) Transcript_102707:67-417(+)